RADADPAVAGEPTEHVVPSETLAPEAEGSSVQVDDGWATRTIGAIAIEVEQIPAARGTVGDVRDPLDPAATGRLGVNPVTPPGSEAVVQSALDRGAGARRPLSQDEKPGRREHGETGPDPEPGAGAALCDRQHCRGDEDRKGNRRPVEPEAEDVAQAE